MKLFMFSEWSMERCSEFASKDLCNGGGLENDVPPCRKTEVLSQTTWKIGMLAGEMKDELFDFLMKTGGNFEMSQVPSHLAHLLAATI